MSFIDSIASFVLLQVGSLVFLSIEFYQEVISTGKLEVIIDKQNDLIAELIRKTLALEDIIKQNGINHDTKDISDLFNKCKTLILGQKETRLLAVKNFLSERFFGSILTSLLNSLVIFLPPILDIITATVTCAIPVVAWVGSCRLDGKNQFIQNLLSYIAISTILGQVAYFAAVFTNPSRSTIIWTPDGLLYFAVGFFPTMVILNIPFLYKKWR